MLEINKVHNLNCLDGFEQLDPESVQLIVTSPPYANQRKELYGGISEEEYPNWTIGWMKKAKKILKPNGNVIINIRPHVKNGEISDYVLKTRLALRIDGWKEIDELIWIKPDGPPLGRVDRPRCSWESLLWFSLSSNPYCAPKIIESKSKKYGFGSNNREGKGHRIGYVRQEKLEIKEFLARTPDYIEIPVSTVDKSEFNTHPAQYPSSLVEWVIKFLSKEGDLIVDPFGGSGSTAVAAKNLNRNFLLFEINQEYCEIGNKRLEEIEGNRN